MTDPLDLSGRLTAEMRTLSDLLKGGVATLVAEGWTEEQARQIVVTTYVAQAKGSK
jgi:hypothetical protein